METKRCLVQSRTGCWETSVKNWDTTLRNDTVMQSLLWMVSDQETRGMRIEHHILMAQAPASQQINYNSELAVKTTIPYIAWLLQFFTSNAPWRLFKCVFNSSLSSSLSFVANNRSPRPSGRGLDGRSQLYCHVMLLPLLMTVSCPN